MMRNAKNRLQRLEDKLESRDGILVITVKYGKEPTEAEIEEAKQQFGREPDQIIRVIDYD